MISCMHWTPCSKPLSAVKAQYPTLDAIEQASSAYGAGQLPGFVTSCTWHVACNLCMQDAGGSDALCADA